jgi:hypothetical protein
MPRSRTRVRNRRAHSSRVRAEPAGPGGHRDVVALGLLCMTSDATPSQAVTAEGLADQLNLEAAEGQDAVAFFYPYGLLYRRETRPAERSRSGSRWLPGSASHGAFSQLILEIFENCLHADASGPL